MTELNRRRLIDAMQVLVGGIKDGEQETWWILEATTGITQENVIAHPEEFVTREDAERAVAITVRRACGEPLQYLLGSTEFYGRSFRCAPGALIPRDDTEVLVRAALEFLPPDSEATVAEIGVGAGAVVITLALERPNLRLIGTDVSAEALEIARANAETWGVADRVDFRQGDLFAPIPETLDVLLSNPPYVATEFLGTHRRMLHHEPRVALDGGDDGLDITRRLADEWRAHVVSGGWFCLETGAGMHEDVGELLGGDVRYWSDYRGITRVVGVRNDAS